MLVWLSRRRREQMQREEYQLGQLCAIGINYSMRAPEKPARAEDFMLHKPVRETAHGIGTEDLDEETRREIADGVRRVMVSLEKGNRDRYVN